jgi:hypothetical protein
MIYHKVYVSNIGMQLYYKNYSYHRVDGPSMIYNNFNNKYWELNNRIVALHTY